MLELLQSNRMSLLLETLSKRLQQPDDPFEPALVVVQSQGIGQWLKVELAKRQGIAANIDCLLPAELIWRLYQRVLPNALGQEELPAESPFSRSQLSWRLMQLLPHHPEAAIQNYLAGSGDPQLRCYQLSHAVASLFDQYLIYRPDWIQDWETSDRHAEIKWQSDLWRELIKLEAMDPRLHRANLHRLFLNTLGQDGEALSAEQQIPKQINVLGVSSLPSMHIQTLQAVAQHNQVSIYFLNPCEHYWGDIESEKRVAKKRSIREILDKQGPLEQEDYLEVGNPLLSSTGQQGREFLELLLETDGIQSAEIFQPVETITALGLIQNDLLNLEFGGEFFDIDQPPRQRDLAADDHSIQIHSAHSRMREVEILLDQLFNLIDSCNGEITGSDIIVVAPDISQYAPFIEAVFQNKLPFSITDRPVVDESSILVAFQKLISLPDMRLTATEVMDFLEVPAIAKRFELGESDLSRLQIWIRNSGIRYEIDGQSKQANWNLPDDDYNTWRFGLDRLLMGLAMESDAGLYRDVAPMNIMPADAELLGKLCDIADLLSTHRDQLANAHTAAGWQSIINLLLSELMLPESDEELIIGSITDALTSLVTEHRQTFYDEEVSPRLFRYWMEQALQQPAQNRGFVSGAITFATLVPMRSIPYQCVCLLGMNDREFPREDKPLSFDLMSKQYRKGDRSRRNDDRYLFLEAIMSAQHTLYLSYIGRGQKDNKEKPPSELLSELTDYLNRVFSNFSTLEHPLQPFDKQYFNDDKMHFSYAAHWHQALTDSEAAVSFSEQPLETEQVSVQHINQLTRFFRHPAKYFLNQQLGVYFNEDQETLKDTESFTLDGLERYQLSDLALQALLNQEPIDHWVEQEKATGLMLPGELGQQQLGQEVRWAETVANAVNELNPAQPEQVTFEIEFAGHHVTCEFTLRDGQYVSPRTGVLRARQRIESWIHHLALCASGYDQESILLFQKRASTGKQVVTESLAPIAPDLAEKTLSELVGYYQMGLERPLLFLPEASLNFAKTESIQEVIKKFSADSTSVSAGTEATDPYYNRVFDLPSDFSHEFSEIAQAVWTPMLTLGGD